jgi:hypothetical protein
MELQGVLPCALSLFDKYIEVPNGVDPKIIIQEILLLLSVTH